MATPNRILERYRNGEKAVGVQMSFVSEIVIEVAAKMGMDFISLDGQHGALTLPTIETVCRLCDAYGMTPTMRVVDQSEAAILTALDRGMQMITVPNLQTAEEAERIVQFGFYGPLGRRSAMSQRVAYGLNDTSDSRKIFEFTNDNTIIVPQLESKTAFDNLDEILQVDGLMFFAGGPQDIAQSMGYPGEPNHPECIAAYEAACDKVRAAGKHMSGDVMVSLDAFGGDLRCGEGVARSTRPRVWYEDWLNCEVHLSKAQVESGEAEPLSPRAARRVLISLMFSSMLMPMVSGMSRVALPVIRDDFGIPADLTAWVLAAFMLPFVVLMPIYGRLSDGVDRRLLILLGTVIFGVGSTMTFLAPNMRWLMAGRAIQGIGVGGMTPMGMALLVSIFSAGERGRVLGTWSAVGPAMSFSSSFVAGLLIALWGWRAAFVPGLLLSVVTFVAIYRGVPSQVIGEASKFLRQFDWGGVGLLSGGIVFLMFYLSSRSVTGVAPFEDWRLLLGAGLFFAGFWWWERGRRDPFLPLNFFGNRMFCRVTFCASMRMFVQGGIGVLMPLYLVDVHRMGPALLGVFLIISSAAMTLIVRFGGQMSDRFQSRWLVMIGMFAQLTVMLGFAHLSDAISTWVIAALLTYYGLGAGLMLAALHSTVMGTVDSDQMGAAAGLYSMLRFMGMAISTALIGVVLQFFFDAGLSTLDAYQKVFMVLAIFPVLGMVVGFGLREKRL